MRVLLSLIAVVGACIVGGTLGGLAGFAMDALPSLGLSPEKFWGTDPENLWASCVVIGAVVGVTLAGIVLAWLALGSRSSGME